jgi:ABC-2 type transport system permease protein
LTLLYDTQSLLNRYLTKMVRNRTLLATNLLTPLIFLLFFSQLLQKLAIFPGVSGSYLAYLTPGIIVVIGILGAPQSGMSIVNDLNSGFLQKLLSTQVSRSAILLGRLIADVFMILIQSIIVIVVAMLMGVTIVTGLLGILLILVTVAFFGLAWSGFFLAVGMRTRKPETLSSVASFLGFLLLFVSTAMFPRAIMPSWAQTVSDFNPVSYASDMARSLIQGGLTWSMFASTYAVIGLMAIVAFAAALYQFRKVIS